MTAGPFVTMHDTENHAMTREQCREAALALLDRRPYTGARLAAKLRAKKFPAPVIADVLDDLERAGLIDDRAFARNYAASRLLPGMAPIGARKLTDALRRQGVPPAVIRDVLEETRGDETIASEAERALDAARRKWPAIQRACPDDPRKARARLWRFLAGRGFDPEAIRSAVDQVCSEP